MAGLDWSAVGAISGLLSLVIGFWALMIARADRRDKRFHRTPSPPETPATTAPTDSSPKPSPLTRVEPKTAAKPSFAVRPRPRLNIDALSSPVARSSPDDPTPEPRTVVDVLLSIAMVALPLSFVCAVAFLVFAELQEHRIAEDLEELATPVEGKIVAIEDYIQYRVDFEFEGEKVSKSLISGYNDRRDRNDEVTVLVDPDNPDRIAVGGDTNYLFEFRKPLIYVIFYGPVLALVVLVIGAVAWFTSD